MKQISFGRTKIKYEIRRGKRKKTVALVVQPNTSVIVLSPYLLSENKIKQVVLKRAGWIIKQQEKIKKLSAGYPLKEFVSGESFPYLGRQYRLKVVRSGNDKNAPCKLIDGRLCIEIDRKLGDKSASKLVREKLLDWYKTKAEEKIKERNRKYAQLIGKRPAKILIRNQEKRWGSCSHSRVVRLNWKIIMAPLSVFDYVLVHELCHLTIKNHSDKFWNKLGSIIHDYKKKRNWLKDNGIPILKQIHITPD
jgi:hypothetical protein